MTEASADEQTILVVEDEVLIRMAIAAYLRECGFKVIEAANADEALCVLQQSDLTVDVLFSDIEMPGSLDGFGLAKWVRQHMADVEVILTGTPKRSADAAAELCESGPLLSKPYEPEALLDEIHRLVAVRASRK